MAAKNNLSNQLNGNIGMARQQVQQVIGNANNQINQQVPSHDNLSNFFH